MKTWHKIVTSAVLSTAIAASGTFPVWGVQGAVAAAVESAGYSLNGSIQAEVKSAAVKTVEDGTQIAAVIRLTNTSAKKTRVPEYELRAVTDGGVEYLLTPSASNAKAVQARETVELVYLSTVDGGDFNIASLSFVEVDEYVYPKLETELLRIPVTATDAGRPGADTPAAAWGTAFTIPLLSSKLTYTPQGWSQQLSEKGQTYLITLLAENPTDKRASLPEFRMDALAGGKQYAGVRTEGAPEALEPGEKAYVHYAVNVDNGVAPEELLILTSDAYGEGTAAVSFDVPRLKLSLPETSGVDLAKLPEYKSGTPISFDPLNQIVGENTQVSLVELHRHENPEQGFQTVVAKFKMLNRGTKPVVLPSFQADLTTAGGASYTGSRQVTAAATLVPNVASVVTYSFNVPKSETSETFGIKLSDTKAAAPFVSEIAMIKAPLQKEEEGGTTYKMYPYDVKLGFWTLNSQFSSTTLQYSYKLTMDLDFTVTDDVMVDAGFSKLKFELADTEGRVIASETHGFAGENRLISGRQTLTFSNLQTEQLQYPLTINVYESVETESGTANRLLFKLKQ
ncbi:hypothetical protein [Paenibacillus mucilaginosus]|uniref:Uncharacterized protein n=1 Tax=Paenibacillus mucilaginosus (strain KNP414) TaxID=1036673 RepID=F8FMF7_PAEMK|nr:hypothetical protein [Paenibacillus mucilaginosus]AEI40040.1 hypothetical protein KNP414_01476 [Paenibacillus mucilaginosus KNP414]MCG7215650.1 hypothetical protein [Paenibacillus mucilaginosus]WDM29284.1 hypothetical protein KCX80_09060 [Paenibacillus mucilaginosus]